MTQEEKAKAYDELKVKASRIYHKENDVLIMHTIEDLFPELKESEDERIRKNLIGYIKGVNEREVCKETLNEWVAWLEKQGEQKSYDTCDSSMTDNKKSPYSEKRDFGYFEEKPADKVEPIEWSGKINSRNAKGVLKEMLDEKLKSEDKVEPKFHEGDWIVFNGLTLYVKEVVKGFYRTISKGGITNNYDWGIDNLAKLWTIQDAKDGDVLVDEDTNVIGIFESIEGMCWHSKFYYSNFTKEFYGIECGGSHLKEFAKPATKEQRDTLFKAMADARYTFDFEKKELRKIEQKPAWSEEDKVKDNWELIHEFVNKFGRIPKDEDELNVLVEYVLKRQKPTEWGEEDEKMLNLIIAVFEVNHPNEYFKANELNDPNMRAVYTEEIVTWLKSIEDRAQSQPKQVWKQENVEELSDFENTMMHIGGSFFGENAGLDPNDTNAIKEQANILLGLVQKQEWSEDDEKMKDAIYSCVDLHYDGLAKTSLLIWLKSLKNKYTWKPSDEQMKVLKELVEDSNQRYFYTLLRSLYDQLKILKGE